MNTSAVSVLIAFRKLVVSYTRGGALADTITLIIAAAMLYFGLDFLKETGFYSVQLNAFMSTVTYFGFALLFLRIGTRAFDHLLKFNYTSWFNNRATTADQAFVLAARWIGFCIVIAALVD